MPSFRQALTGGAVITILLLMVAAPPVAAQAQHVQATPGYINLGMSTFILVTAPAAGSYSVVVQQPNGTESTLSFNPTSSGQVLNATYGNLTEGFKALVDQAGTYNVFLEQGSQVVSSTSFYATNQLRISIEVVIAGTCDYVSGVTRGSREISHIFIAYASNDAPWNNTAKGASVYGLLPSGQWTAATWDPYSVAWHIGIYPNWNYTFVGPWNPVINASDAAGNTGTLKYTGSPFTISPVELGTSITVVNATSGLAVTNLVNGQTVTIQATIAYPTNVEPVSGFVAPLSPTRGGSVSTQVGWGYYNTTSGTFGGTKLPGALLGTVPMAYSGNSTIGAWTGQFVSSSLPKLQPGYAYEVVVTSKDGASPANTGFGMEILSPASSTVTTISTTATQTATTTATQTSTQTVQAIPDAVYAALAILLIVGVLIGYIVRVPR